MRRSGPQECPHLVAPGGMFESRSRGETKRGRAMSQSHTGSATVQGCSSPNPTWCTGCPTAHTATAPATALQAGRLCLAPGPGHSHGWTDGSRSSPATAQHRYLAGRKPHTSVL